MRTSAAPAKPTIEDDATRLTRLLDSLPTLPIVALRLGELVHSRRSSVQQVAEVLRGDPSLSAKLLRLVNSAYFGIPGGVTDVGRAIPFIGFNTIYQLVLSVSVLETLKAPSGARFDPKGLWLHSLAVASAARVIGEEIRHPDPGSLFTAGLLHDMGKIALAKVSPEEFIRATTMIRDEGLASVDAEHRVGLPGHDKVGSDLARRWRLPAALSVPIESHHVVVKPELRERMVGPHRVAAEVIAVSDLIAQDVAITVGADGQRPIDPLAKALLETLGIGTTDLESLYSRVMAQLERSRPFLALLDG
ncbi:MAG TPA: HDOD domain-containing protein [Kofleriaceae bacterium]|nr:HDOD domain-containing protein [Kofleriaceae bacterium]